MALYRISRNIDSDIENPANSVYLSKPPNIMFANNSAYTVVLMNENCVKVFIRYIV